LSDKHHTINYIEMPSSDIAKTKSFYGSVFGWTFTDWGPEYISFEGAGIDGGFRADGAVTAQAPGVLVVLYSSNLEETQQKIESARGEITIPVFEFPGGRRFHFKDTSGNELAVWSE
jgi:uncharacterized protein